MTTTEKPISIKRGEQTAREEKETMPAPVGAWAPFASLRREIDRLFEDATSGWPFGGPKLDLAPWARFSGPAADIVETDGAFTMSLDLPGMDEKDIEVKLSDGVVTVEGEKSEEKTEEKGTYRLSERRRGSFSRSFTLPPSVDAEKVSATYEKGVLKLVMPKSEAAQKKQRKIAVKAA